MRTVWILLIVFAFVAPFLNAQSDPCRCHAVSKQDGGSGSGSCIKPGTGLVPCFDLIELSDTGGEGGLVGHGICDVAGCQGARNCRYTIKNVIIVAASCAATCIRGGASDKVSASIITDGVSGTQREKGLVPGQHRLFSVGAYKAWVTRCGTPPRNRTLKFTNDLGAEVFSVTFTFGCSNCTQVAF